MNTLQAWVRPDAEDAAQAVFLVLWKKAPQLQRRSSIACWLLQVAQNVCRNAKRARKARQKHELGAAGIVPSPPPADDKWEVVKEHLDVELNRLQEEFRLPIILFQLEGQTQTAINSASDGDTVHIPAGVSEWTATVRIDDKGITQKGAGDDKTILTPGTGIDQFQNLLDVNGRKGETLRIAGIGFRAGQSRARKSLIHIHGSCTTWRVDHCRFDVARNIGVAVSNSDQNFGVVDHCRFSSTLQSNAIGIRVTGSGDSDWQHPQTRNRAGSSHRRLRIQLAHAVFRCSGRGRWSSIRISSQQCRRVRMTSELL